MTTSSSPKQDPKLTTSLKVQQPSGTPEKPVVSPQDIFQAVQELQRSQKVDLTSCLEVSKEMLTEIRQLRDETVKMANAEFILEIDLTVARNMQDFIIDSPNRLGAPARYMTVIAVPSAFKYSLNQSQNTQINAAVGDRWDNMEIFKLVITNAALSGTGVISLRGRKP